MIRRLLVLFLALPLLWLSGCSSTPKDKSLEPADLIKFDATAKLDKVWSSRVGDGQGGKFNRLQPVMRDGVIYVASAEGEIAALNALDGKEIWEVDLEEPLSGAVGLGDNSLFVGTPNGEVVAIDQLSGEKQWHVSVGSEILSAPVAHNGVVVVEGFDGNIYGLNAADGSRNWLYDSTRPVLTLRASATPIIIDDTAYAGLANGRVVALDLQSGQVKWDARVAIPRGQSEIERIVDINGSPLIVDNALYAVSYQGRLLKVASDSGRPVWDFKASSDGGLAEGFGNVYFSSAEGSVVAVDRNSGGMVWEQTQLANRQLNTPTAYGNYLLVGDFEGYIHVLSQTDGSMVVRKKLGSDGIRARILSDGDMFYVYGNNGHLVAYKIVE